VPYPIKSPVSELWNNLGLRERNAPSVDAFKTYHKRSLPKKNTLYSFGNRLEAVAHARLRIGNSLLNADLNKINVVPSPLCLCRLGVIEDAKHYFFECPRYDIYRASLKTDLLPFIIDNTNHLLFGVPDADHLANIHIFGAVHKYIKNTDRFK
jgi:hypothetical protein